jgi:hypothetical protein
VPPSLQGIGCRTDVLGHNDFVPIMSKNRCPNYMKTWIAFYVPGCRNGYPSRTSQVHPRTSRLGQFLDIPRTSSIVLTKKIIHHTHNAPYFEYGNDDRPRNFHECQYIYGCPTTGLKYLEVSVPTSWDITSCPRFI